MAAALAKALAMLDFLYRGMLGILSSFIIFSVWRLGQDFLRQCLHRMKSCEGCRDQKKCDHVVEYMYLSIILFFWYTCFCCVLTKVQTQNKSKLCTFCFVTVMVSNSGEAGTARLPSTMVYLQCHEGSELEPPFMDRTILTGKVQMKLAQLPPNLGRYLTLKKLHVKENGWAVLLFFEPIQESLQPEVAELLGTWVGSQGNVRYLTFEEAANQTMQDLNHKGAKRSASSSLGDLEKTTNLLTTCLALQGSPATSPGIVKKQQRRNAALALRCFNRAQAQTSRNLHGSSEPKLEANDACTDEDEETT